MPFIAKRFIDRQPRLITNFAIKCLHWDMIKLHEQVFFSIFSDAFDWKAMSRIRSCHMIHIALMFVRFNCVLGVCYEVY